MNLLKHISMLTLLCGAHGLFSMEPKQFDSLQHLAFKASITHNKPATLKEIPKLNIKNIDPQTKQLIPIVKITEITPDQFEALDPYDRDTCSTVCTMYCEKNENTVNIHMPLYRKLALLPPEIRVQFGDKKIVVHRDVSGKFWYVASNGLSGLLVGGGLGGFVGLTGIAPAIPLLLGAALTSSSSVMTDPTVTQPLATNIEHCLSVDKLNVPVLHSPMNNWTMITGNDTIGQIQTGLNAQITDHIHANSADIATTVVNHGLSSANAQINQVHNQVLQDTAIGARWGCGIGLCAGVGGGLWTMNNPIIETKIATIGEKTEPLPSVTDKIGHVAKCTALGAFGGAGVGAAAAYLKDSPYTPALLQAGIQGGLESLMSRNTSERIEDITEKSIDPRTINLHLVEEKLNFIDKNSGMNVIGGLATYDNDTIQKSTANMMKNSLQSDSNVYANAITKQTWQGASENMQTMVINPTYANVQYSAGIGAGIGAVGGFVYGIRTMNDKNKE